ncbi:nucleotide exchange factor GrpE [Planobispora rosea]|uniref:nucleotide exchange factor GrpE n=1 Tax=Planobispora rosea TaxID=35762 RepID=UPI00083AE321|nr:nucleotide exchange factor GrpE [Planobispora rosea]
MRDRRALLSLLLLGCLALAACGRAEGLGGDAAGPGGEAVTAAPPSASAGKGEDVQRLRPREQGQDRPGAARTPGGAGAAGASGGSGTENGPGGGDGSGTGDAPGLFGPVPLTLALVAGALLMIMAGVLLWLRNRRTVSAPATQPDGPGPVGAPGGPGPVGAPGPVAPLPAASPAASPAAPTSPASPAGPSTGPVSHRGLEETTVHASAVPTGPAATPAAPSGPAVPPSAPVGSSGPFPVPAAPSGPPAAPAVPSGQAASSPLEDALAEVAGSGISQALTQQVERLFAGGRPGRQALVEACIGYRDQIAERHPQLAGTLLDGLHRAGVREIVADGRPFDPRLHEAFGTEPTDRPELHDIVAETIKQGYTDGDHVIRVPQVAVYRYEPAAPEQPEARGPAGGRQQPGTGDAP